MSTVISSLRLFLILFVGLFTLTGLGWLVIKLFLGQPLYQKAKKLTLLQLFSTALICGMIVNFGIVLCFQSLQTSLILSFCIAAVGLFLLARDFRRNHTPIHFSQADVFKATGILFTCLILLVPLFKDALLAWDARYIFFFHAKRIYYAGTFGQAAGWELPYVQWFSHVDYPQLPSVLLAEVAYAVGTWNEYLPKVGLIFLLIPGIMLLFSFGKKTFSFLFLFLAIPFSFYPWLWNGYMDGLLGFYFSLALLFLGDFLISRESDKLIPVFTCTVFLLYIKNEGVLALLTIACTFILVQIIQKKKIQRPVKLNQYFGKILAGILLLLPFFIWNFYKKQWNLANDLELGTTDSFVRLWTRLTDGSVFTILEKSFGQIEAGLMIFLLIFFVFVLQKKTPSKACIFSLIAAGIYCAGMIAIYLMTPHGLEWHLVTSVQRTMFLVNGGLFVAGYFLLNQLEQDEKSSQMQMNQSEKSC